MSSGLVPVEVHLGEVLATVRPLEPVRAGLEAAEGCALAEDVTAVCPLPSFDNSAMDGYAVRASDVAGASEGSPVTLPVTDEIPAGDTRTLTVPPGMAVRIMTGALMPAGADAVVPVEWTDGGRGRVRITQPATPGNAIRRRGGDVTEGEVLLKTGTRLGPAQIALLAAGGHGSALVRPRPRVSVIATGSELTEPGSPLSPGRIWDSNSYMLAAAVREAGGEAVRRWVTDDPAEVLTAIEEESGTADLLLTSGGVSMGGEHDVVKAALAGDAAEAGNAAVAREAAVAGKAVAGSDAPAGKAQVTFRKVAMQPGMPQGFGVVGANRAPIFTLPGNPVSAFVSFHLFVRPAMDVLRGLSPGRLPTVRAALAGPVRSPGGKRSFLRGVLDSGTVTPLTGQGSHQLGALARANALIIVPEQVTSMEEGEVADVMSLP